LRARDELRPHATVREYAEHGMKAYSKSMTRGPSAQPCQCRRRRSPWKYLVIVHCDLRREVGVRAAFSWVRRAFAEQRDALVGTR
jgi:hypothetical protein